MLADIKNCSPTNSAVKQLSRRLGLFFLVLLSFVFAASVWSASFYTQRLDDPRAVYVAPSGGDDTAALQKAVNQVQESTGQGIVLLAPGRYRISDTFYIWPGIRLIGYGDERPVIVLPANTPGFGDASHEKLMVFFAGRRPRDLQAGNSSVPGANPGTFYSALANIDVEVQEGNPGAVAVRSHYAQHCFLAHMDFRLGSALAGITRAVMWSRTFISPAVPMPFGRQNLRPAGSSRSLTVHSKASVKPRFSNTKPDSRSFARISGRCQPPLK